MVSAPATSWIWRQSRPASRQRGPRGDHAVFGEVPAPFAPGVHSGAENVERFGRAHRCDPPARARALDAVVVGEQRHGGQLHLHADLQVGRQRALDHLAQDDEPLVGQLHRGDGKRLKGVRGGVGRGRRDSGFRCSSTAFPGSTTRRTPVCRWRRPDWGSCSRAAGRRRCRTAGHLLPIRCGISGRRRWRTIRRSRVLGLSTSGTGPEYPAASTKLKRVPVLPQGRR